MKFKNLSLVLNT